MKAFTRALTLELRHLRQDRWDLAGLTLVPGALIFIVAAIFWQGPMRQLPLAVVDSDGSSASRAVIRAIDASPLVQVAGFYPGEVDAVRAVRSGKAMGFVHLPQGLGGSVARHREPVVRILYNGSFLTAGGQVSRATAEAVREAIPDIAANQLANHAVPTSRVRHLAIEATPLGNAPSSFEWFLGLLIFPAVLHLITACGCAMALGRELRDRSLTPWASASGGVAPALAGKMLPYIGAISLWGLAWLFYLTLCRGWRIEGSIAIVAFGQTLFYAATAAIAALLVAATRETATALSASAVYAGSALAYSGAMLPLNGANAFARVWSNVLPLSHYVALQMGQVSGQSITASVAPTASLAAYVAIAGGSSLALIIVRAPSMSFGSASRGTWRAILTSRTLLNTTLLAVVLYAFYYPAPYSHEAAQKLPVVLVDQDASALSRSLIVDLDATRAIRVVDVVPNIATARQEMRRGTADGVILIADGLERQIRTGTPGAGIAVWVNATYLLRASTIGEAVTAVIQNIARTQLLPGTQLSRAGPPVDVITEPLFNRTGGYKGYVFPAVAVIIVQQTLLFGAATFMGGRRRSGDWRMGVAQFGGTLAAFSSVGVLGCYFLFGFVFWLQGVPVDGNITGMTIIVPVFATVVAALGLLVGSLFDRAERATHILAPTSVPFFFLTGTAYPLDQMPRFVAAFSDLIPSTPGVHTFVPLNQMHASLDDLSKPILTLLILAVAYTTVAYLRIVDFGMNKRRAGGM